MIEVKNISKTYGDQIGVRNLNFSTRKGEILGFLGVNGAGKTTTMNIITGYLPPSEGQVLINGVNLHQKPLEAKKMIGFLPENPPLYPDLQVDQYLKFVCDLKGVSAGKRGTHINEVLESTGLTAARKRLIKNLSKGYRQRVGIAQALVSDPEFIVLDEPTVGLDPKQILEIRNLIKNLGRKSTVMLSSHILTEVNMICDRVIIINKGEIVAVDTPENLVENLLEYDRFFIKAKAPADEFIARVKSIKGILSIRHMENDTPFPDGFNDFTVENEKSADVRSPMFRMMAEQGYVAYEIKTIEVSLEDAFLRITNSGTNNKLEIS